MPRYLRGFLWDISNYSASPTALSTLHDDPLPSPPPSEFNPSAVSTLSSHSHLFRIVTPIDVSAFHELLRNHPNPLFVQSVIDGLTNGFWPWSASNPSFPTTHDESHRPPKSDKERQFLRSQRDIEVAAGRLSPSFGPDLLPGMYSMPIHSVPKPRSSDLRLVVDHSAGDFSLNAMIPREAIAGCRLDTLKHLGGALLQYRRKHGNVRLVLFKSDVSLAYRRMPLHPLYQLKQVITVDGNRFVDRCNNFGNRAAFRIWISFMALVVWIATFVLLIEYLFVYVDDTFSFEEEGNMTYYAPYDTSYPAKQTRLLQLWDRIGLPHDKKKQLFGTTLTIIGFECDPNEMSFTMSPTARKDLADAIDEFVCPARGGRRHPLRKFQVIAGWINWSLNVFPLLRPALSNVYDKTAEKTNPNALVFLNKGVCDDLLWFKAHLLALPGVLLLNSVLWDPSQAHITIHCDASLGGLAFVDLSSGKAALALPPPDAPPDNIFFLEALAVAWAIQFVASSGFSGRLCVVTDSSNTFDIFDSLAARPLYNNILKFSVDLLINHCIDLRVSLIPGPLNSVADALSRWRVDDASRLCPHLQILPVPLPSIPCSHWRPSAPPARSGVNHGQSSD